MPPDMRDRPPWAVAALGVVLVSCGGGASTAGSASGTASISVSSTTAGSTRSSGLHIALAVQGRADPTNQGFVDDQEGLFDPSQFTDPQLYPPGYHWRVDRQFNPGDLVSAVAMPGQVGTWELVLTLTAGGAARFDADSRVAYAAPQGTPANHLAIFVGPRVIQAPQVVFPASGPETVIGGLTEQQAKAIAAELAADARP